MTDLILCVAGIYIVVYICLWINRLFKFNYNIQYIPAPPGSSPDPPSRLSIAPPIAAESPEVGFLILENE